jgi:trk system potassium uptake protein TrkA
MADVLIVGGGRIGAYLTGLLHDGGYRARLIEVDPLAVERLARTLPADQLVLGDGTDPDVLEAVGARRADTVVAVTARDETNLVVTSLAKFEFGVARTIGRVNNPNNAWLYTAEMGVDVALNQADIIGHLVAEEMSLGEMMTLLKLRRGQFALVEEKVHPNSAVVGKSLAELGLPRGCVFVGIIRGADLIAPNGATVIHAADEVLAVVHTDVAATVASLLGPAAA